MSRNSFRHSKNYYAKYQIAQFTLIENATREILLALVNSISSFHFFDQNQVIATLFVASCSASYYGAISTQFQAQDGHGGYSYGYR